MFRDKRGGGVFFCYRREDSGYTGRLYDRVRDRFPNRVFFDVADIPLGQNFVETIRRAIMASRVLIAVIGKNWQSATDPDGHRRLDNAQDFVRIEIAMALEGELEILPVLLPGAAMPRAEELPDDIAALAHRQAIEISDADFDHDVDLISGGLEKALGITQRRRYLRGAALVLAALALIAAGAAATYVFGLRTPTPDGTKAPVTEVRPDPPAPGNSSVPVGEPVRKPKADPPPDTSGGIMVPPKNQTSEADARSKTSTRVAGLWFAPVAYWRTNDGEEHEEWAFEFHPAGSNLAGTLRGPDGARGLVDGRIEGNAISFRTVWRNRPTYGGGPGGQTTYRDWWTDYQGQVHEKSIQFFMQRDGAGTFQFTAYRREALPKIESFRASAETVALGASVNLCYQVRYAARVAIEPSIGVLDRAGDNCVTVRPAKTTQFVLRAVSAAGVEQRQKVKVIVDHEE